MSAGTTLWAIAALVLVGAGASAQYPAQVKFLSYNLWAGQNAITPGGYETLADVINEISPDVSGHQEVDRVNKRSRRTDVIAYLGDLTGMHPLFAPALKGARWVVVESTEWESGLD